MKHISLKEGKYRINKYHNGKTCDYGSYPILEVAQKVRDKLEKIQWDINSFPTTIFKIKNKYHVVANLTEYNIKTNIAYLGECISLEEAENLAKNPLQEKYINKQGKKYVIIKVVNKKRKAYGYFKEHETAYAMRHYLILCNWLLPTHKQPYIIYIDNQYYLLRAENNYLTCIDHNTKKEKLTSEDNQNIYKTKQGYSIARVVNKQRENFLTYSTIKEAKSMRDFLISHDWNKEIFQKEYERRYPKLPEYIAYSHKYNKYVVKRRWKGITKSYGRFNTIEEAVSKVRWLESHNWQTNNNLNIVNYDGTFHIYKSITVGYCTPFREYYYSSEDKEDALETLEKYKTEGFPKPIMITNKYRYIIRNRQLYYIMYHKKKLCYTHKLKYAFVARDICEWLGMKPLSEGVYVWDDVEYVVELNPYGTPVFSVK